MKSLTHKIHALDWESIANSLHHKGAAMVPQILTAAQCKALRESYASPQGFRKTVVMERYRFGLGEYKYYNYPLPDVVQTLRETIYPHLVPVANQWMNLLNLETRFPATHAALQAQCDANQQLKATPLLLKYGKGGFNTLHQDLYGEVYFPLQVVIGLNQPAVDYTGGELVLTQQIPRAQSKAMVFQPKLGEMIIFTTNFRPIKGSRGYYRATMRHGVSEVTHGERHTLGVNFHDATS